MKIIRSKERITKTAEIFTPEWAVEIMLDNIDNSVFKDGTKTFADIACGDGNILVGILKRRLARGVPPELAIYTLYGFDIMADNIQLAKLRLSEIAVAAGGSPETIDTFLDHNIRCVENTLTYDFDSLEPCEITPKMYRGSITQRASGSYLVRHKEMNQFQDKSLISAQLFLLEHFPQRA